VNSGFTAFLPARALRYILPTVLHRNVLIFHQAALGDFIVTWPLAMALSRIMPQSRIIYVTHSQKGKLAERVLRVESADAEGGWHALFSDAPQLPERAAKLLEGAHTVVSFSADSDDPLARGVARVAPHAKLVSLDTKKPGSGHVTQSLMQQLDAWPALAAAMQQMLRSVESRGTGFHLSPQDRIVIHPGAGKEANRWPAEKYLELIRKLRDAGKQVRVLLGEAELDRWPATLIGQFEALSDVHWPVTLLELLDELAGATAFVGNDSGPAHLAGIIGVSTIAIFGGADPTRWQPLGPRVQIIQDHSIAAIEMETVYTHVVRLAGD